MLNRKRPLVILSASAALFALLAVAPHDAEARHRHRWRAGGAIAGAVVGAIAGAVIADAVGASAEATVYAPPVASRCDVSARRRLPRPCTCRRRPRPRPLPRRSSTRPYTQTYYSPPVRY